MLIKNGLVLDDQWTFKQQNLLLEADEIISITQVQATPETIGTDSDLSMDTVIDATGLYVIPGLIDIHIHACAGYDFCDATSESIQGMSGYLGQQGITSFVAASMAFDEPRLGKIFQVAGKMMDSDDFVGAQLRGIHMEGPFFSKAKKGAQSEKYIIDPDIAMFERLNQAAGERISIVDVAPELDGAMEFIFHAAKSATVAVAHTTADYDTAMEAFTKGASHVIHLFNAMPPFSHRDPGVVGAASDAGATIELICDGIHLHPAVIRSVFKWFGADNVVLISDAMRACGLADGEYDLGGQEVHVSHGKATLADGTIAGSATDLHTCMRRAVEYGIPLAQAVKSATYNPAKVVGIDGLVGSIAVGKRADLVLLDQSLAVVGVIIGGKRFF